jgi:hypothetical protein
MVCMEHFQHFVKERLSLKLESAMPAVDQPVVKADVKQVREMVLFLSLRSTRSTAATLPLLLIQTKQWIYKQRGLHKG